MSWNQRTFLWIHQFAGRNPVIDGIAIFFASYILYFLIIGFALLVLLEDGPRKKWYLFCEGALATLLARGLVTEIIRFFYHHPRPFDFYGFAPLIAEFGWSFPSGHMTFLFALAMIVWYRSKPWGFWYLLLSAVVGVARIYVGVHWPLDVIGGAVIGILCAVIIHALFRKPRIALYEPSSRDPDVV